MTSRLILALLWTATLYGCHATTPDTREDVAVSHIDPRTNEQRERGAGERARPLASSPLSLREVDLAPRPWLEPGTLYHRVSLAHVTCQDHIVIHETSRWRRARTWLVDVQTGTRYKFPKPLHSTSLEHCDTRGMILSGEGAIKGVVAYFDFTRKAWHMPGIETPHDEAFDTGLWRREFFDVEHITPVQTDEGKPSGTFVISGHRNTLTYRDPLRINAMGIIDTHEFGVGLWSPGRKTDEHIVIHTADTTWEDVAGAMYVDERLLVTLSKLESTPQTPSRHGTCCGPYHTYTSYLLEGSQLRESDREAVHDRPPDYSTFEDFDDIEADRHVTATTSSEIAATWTDEAWQKIFVDERTGQTWLAHANTPLSSLWAKRASRSVYARSHTRDGQTLYDVYLLDFDAEEQRFIDTYEDCPGRLVASNIAADIVALRCEQGPESEHIWSEVIDIAHRTRWRSDASQRAERVLSDGRVILSDAANNAKLWVLRP